MPQTGRAQPDRPETSPGPGRGTILAICVCLGLATWAVFGQTLRHDFVNYDDDQYVYANPMVSAGLTIKGVVWAFTRTHWHNWHPLTWISHMLDCEIYGLDAGGHHLTSVLLHATAAILLFLALRRMTACVWRSAFVAALFATHPLHVESVAWVSERKDVLSGVFFGLTLAAYARYVGPATSLGRYLGVAFCFALGLLSKPMLVTLPLILLLLDYWPLGRLSPTAAGVAGGPALRLGSWSVSRRPLLEKVPLLVLSLASSVATLAAQGGAVQPLERLALSTRIENALVSYAAYLGQSVAPVGLSVFYPHRLDMPLWKPIAAAVLLALVSAIAFALRRSRPYLLVGWLWYLVMLLPVIGIVQVGAQAQADRYTYLPQIGLFVLVAWAAADLASTWRRRRVVLGAAAAIVIALSISAAHVQASYWRDSESLWTHALSSTSNNSIAHGNLGAAQLQAGRLDVAIANLERALEIDPGYADAHNNLGYALSQQGRLAEAIAQYRMALEIDPHLLRAHYNLGNALLQAGRVQEAFAPYQEALRIDPSYAEVHNNLGIALLSVGRVGEAIAHFQTAIELRPTYVDAHRNLAWVLATGPAKLRDGVRAVGLAERAYLLSGGALPILPTLAASYAEAGRFSDAVRTAEQAIEAAQAQGQEAFARQVQQQLELYRAGSALHLGPAEPGS